VPKIISVGTPNPEDLKQNPLKDLWEGFRSLDKFMKMSLLSGVLLIVFGVYAAGNVLETRQQAGGGTLSRVDINPGVLELHEDNNFNTEMSALAYNVAGDPIWDGVYYEWGTSSTNSVGTLTQTVGNITQYDPLKTGCGEVHVIARYGDQTITKSIQVTVQPARDSGQPDIKCETTPEPISSSRVFVTSTTYDGNLGGLEGADAKCQERANAANLGGQWKAWLSDTNTSAASRITHSNNSYKLLNGNVIANNWEDLIDGSIQNSINLDEFKRVPSYQSCVWTSTATNGNFLPKSANLTACSDYTSADANYSWCGHNGSKDFNWTKWSTDVCSNSSPLYCFEQPSSITPTPTPLQNQTLQLTPKADSFVRSNNPAKNYGSSNEMWIDGKPQSIVYLKFDLSRLSGKEILNAKLRLRVANITDSQSGGTFRIHPVLDNSWEEKKIKFSNKPSMSPAIASFSNPKKQQSIEIDLTGVISSGSGSVSLAIDTGSSDGAVIRSKEAQSASNRPTLIVGYR